MRTSSPHQNRNDGYCTNPVEYGGSVIEFVSDGEFMPDQVCMLLRYTTFTIGLAVLLFLLSQIFN
jgi:hypothetical protein